MDDYLNNQDKPLSRYSAERISGLLQEEIAEVLAFSGAVARRTGLGSSEMSALEHLYGAAGAKGRMGGVGGGLTPKEIGVRLGLTSGAVTALVDRLEKAGLAERVPNPEDRRSSVVRITPSGRELGSRHLLALGRDLAEAAAALTEEERAAVGAYLKVVTEIIGRHARG